MVIVEHCLESKTGDILFCEDGIFINDHFIAVIDGVTPKGKIKWAGNSSGFYAKEIIKKGLEKLTGPESMEDVFCFLNHQIKNQYEKREKFFLENPEERLQATLVIYSLQHRQIWCFGDCQYMLDDEAFSEEMKIDTLLAEVRSVFLRLEIMSGKTIDELCLCDPSVEIILPILKRQFFFSNRDCDYGFQVLDGFCEDFSHVHVRDVAQGSMVILASDGYPKIYPTLAQSENYLTTLKDVDPLCICAYKSTRGFTNGKVALDDRAYIRFVT